jgi:hypothetical protein
MTVRIDVLGLVVMANHPALLSVTHSHVAITKRDKNASAYSQSITHNF